MTIIDFNTATRQGEAGKSSVDADDIRQRLHGDAENFIKWLYSGRALIARGEARIGNVYGEPGASLSIKLSGSETGLWHDHANGDGGDLIALYRACMGYSGNTNFPQSLKEIASEFLGDPVEVDRTQWQASATERIEKKKQEYGTKPRADMLELGAPVATYRYYDTRGNVIASVVRYEPDGTRKGKTFRPYCFKTVDGKAKWIGGAPDLRPLYRLPEIALASTVVLCEGEGKAEALARIGIEATSAMQGANAPIDKTDWSPLHGKTVIIWPDNDEPGARYSAAVAERLTALGCAVKLVEIPAGKPQGWDAVDCIAEGIDPRLLIDKAAAEEAKTPSVDFTAFVWTDPAALPRREWLYGVHLIRKFVSVTVAPGGMGKSSLVLTEALALATGRPLLGETVHERCNVAIWNGEDPLDELKRRVAAACTKQRVEPEEIAGRLFLNSGRDMPMVVVKKIRDEIHIMEPVVHAVITSIEKHKIDVLVIDPFVLSHEVPENDNGAIDRAVRQWARIADLTNCAVELVHHVRKGAAGHGEFTVEDGRGAIALIAAARSARVLNRMTKEEAELWGVDEPSRFFRTDNGKNNLSVSSDRSTWYRIGSIELPNGDNVGAITSWQKPDPLANQTVQNLIDVQKAIDGKGYRANIQSSEWVGHAIGRVLGLDTLKLDFNATTNKKRIASMIRVWVNSGALVITRACDKKTA